MVEAKKANDHWLQSILQECSFTVTCLESTEILKKNPPISKNDVIVLDLSLPECRGIECVKEIKGIFPDNPLVIAAPAEEEALTFEAVMSGAEGFIRIKTLGVDSIKAIIQQALARQKTDTAVRESQKELSRLVSNLPGFIYRCLNDQNWSMEYLSRGCEKITGYKPEDIISGNKITYEQIIHPDDRKIVRQSIHKAVDKGEQYQLEYRIQTADGKEKWVWEQGNKIFSIKDSVKLEGFITDITDKKMREFQMRLIMRIGAIQRSSVRYQDYSRMIMEEIREFYKSESAALLFLTKPEGTVRVKTADGKWEPLLGGEFNIRDYLCYQAIKDNQIIFHNIKDGSGDLCPDFLDYSSQYIAFIPISTQNNKFGLIVLGKEYPFLETDQEVFETISDMLASAIERTDLYEKIERQLKRLESLHAIDQAITSIFDIKVIFKIIIDQMNKELGADAVDILVLNSASNMLECASMSGFFADEVVRNTKLPLTTSIAGKVLLENKKISVSNLDEEPLLFVRNKLHSEKFKAYYAYPLSVKGEVVGVIETFFRKPFYPDQDWLGFFEALVTQAAVAYDSYRKYADLQRVQQNMASSFRSTLETWSKSLELHQIESHDHIRRVTDQTLQLSREMGIDEQEMPDIERGALLHDIGKIGIMDNILQKKGTLTEVEWVEIKRHPQIARDLLSNVKMLENAMDIPYCHHENWDGSGYPQGLKGEEIPLPARIFAVVETFDALTSSKPYRKAWSKSEAIKYLTDEKGKKFDPEIIDRFLKILQAS